jgi:hypothetical protein
LAASPSGTIESLLVTAGHAAGEAGVDERGEHALADAARAPVSSTASTRPVASASRRTVVDRQRRQPAQVEHAGSIPDAARRRATRRLR